MHENLIPIDPYSIDENPFKLLGKDNGLVTAGSIDSWNTMTIGWGAFGPIWGRPAAFVLVRPTRHTFGFMEENPGFTVSFFPESLHGALEFCGSKSGREVDKAKGAGLNPFEVKPGFISFREARLVFVCRKMYAQDLDPALFLDPSIMKSYPKKDYHRLYVGEIVECLRRNK